MDPLAPRVASRFFDALRRRYDIVKVAAANGEATDVDVLKRCGSLVVHVILGGKGYGVTHVPTGTLLKESIPSRREADGLCRHFGEGPGRTLLASAFREGTTALRELEAEIQRYKAPPKKGRVPGEST